MVILLLMLIAALAIFSLWPRLSDMARDMAGEDSVAGMYTRRGRNRKRAKKIRDLTSIPPSTKGADTILNGAMTGNMFAGRLQERNRIRTLKPGASW